MTTQTFTDAVTLTAASWFNDVDNAAYEALTGVGGTANAITATGPANYTHAVRNRVRFIPSATNTSTATITITPSGGAALAARNIFWNGAACSGGEIKSGVPTELIDDGTRLNIVGPGVPSARTLLASGTATSSATLDFTNLQGYAAVEFVAQNLVPTNVSSQLQINATTNNGISWVTGGTQYAVAGTVIKTDGTSAVSIAGATLGDAYLTGQMATSASYGFSGTLVGYNLDSTTMRKMFVHSGGYGGLSLFEGVFGTNLYNVDTSAINGVRFKFSGGSISTGTIFAYGIRKT